MERRIAGFIDTGRVDIDCDQEDMISRYSNRVVCLNSAAAAEELNLRILGVTEGDEVVVPSYTYTSSASAAVHCGAKVVFVDVLKDGDSVSHMPEMDYEKPEDAITEKTKAIVAVDFCGIVCDYEKIFEIVERKRSLFKPMNRHDNPKSALASRIQSAIGRVAVIADSAHSLGASRVFKGEKRYCGDIADFTSFSFHAVNVVSTTPYQFQRRLGADLMHGCNEIAA